MNRPLVITEDQDLLDDLLRVAAAALVALLVHFGMYYGQISPYHNNPAVPATCALVISTLVMLVGSLVRRGD